MVSIQVVDIAIIEPDPLLVAIGILQHSGGEDGYDDTQQLGIGKKKQCRKNLNSIAATQLGNASGVVTCYYDGDDYEPDVKRKHKLTPGNGKGVDIIVKASFNTQI